jgi:ureidoglycolate hydrolase
MPTTHTVRAEPLSEVAFAPFGQVLAVGDAVMELREGELFHLNVMHHDRQSLRCDHLNRHHKATQALVALAGKATLLVVAAAGYDFSTQDHNEIAHLERDLGVVVEVVL